MREANAVNHMISKELTGVEFSVLTQRSSFKQVSCGKKLQLGDSGLGAGAKPEVGKEAAENEIEKIKEVSRRRPHGFYYSRYGGGTGTGAAPIIAQAAKK